MAAGSGGPPGSLAPIGSMPGGTSIEAPQWRQIEVPSARRATAPLSRSWSAPIGSWFVVKSHFG